MANPEARLVLKMIDLIKLANINLNHFPKHEKYGLCQQIRQNMYGIYDLIIEAEKRYHKKTTLVNLDIAHEQLLHEIGEFLREEMQLVFSKWIISPVKKGINFVGFRTWRSTRYVRKRSLHNFSKALKKNKLLSLISIIGNGKRTATYAYFLHKLKIKGVELCCLNTNHSRQRA